jgi:murein DD-endopeptidase MepM/ murein hydrolase activator NlpD
LYKQLSWLADRLNRGFYDAKYQELDVLTFSDGAQLLTAESVNAGTLAVQYVLSLNNSMDTWLYDVSSDGFKQVYLNLFGSETIDGFDLSPIPAQPTITLPFRQRDVWRLTGGFHGGWGSGSAWSALDFAPPDDRQDGDPLCYVSEYPVVAVADGVIARSSDGAVVLDLDGDGDERTGWTIFYLHLDIDPAITTGTLVQAGASLGKPSCHGGFSTATHLHIARRYNGEWVPLDCEQCDNVPPFIMGEWQAVGYTGQEYQGYMVNLFTNQQVIAEQARNTTINEISW